MPLGTRSDSVNRYAMIFAEVAVNAPAGYDRTFSYSIPDSLKLSPGHSVRVPFGPRKLQGVIFTLEPIPQVPETRDIIEAIDPDPVLTETQLDLARWISRYYMCSLFDAAALMLPPGGRERVKTYLSLNPEKENDVQASLTSLQERVLSYILKRDTVRQEQVINLFGEGCRASIATLVGKGIIVRTTTRNRPSISPKYRDFAILTDTARPHVTEWLREAARKAPRRAALVTHLLDESPLDLTYARKEYGPGAVNALLSKGWIEKERIAVERNPLEGKIFEARQDLTLTQRQASVASEIRAVISEPSQFPRTVLIQGVTGSGKTEVYMDAVDHCLNQGKRAIVLVPEIALTPQTIERFASRFPERVAVLHSGLSPGERFDQWWKIKQGEYGIVIGSRSAVFAPQPDLGLIVVDEEHEWTYKQHDGSPRYHTRSVALKLSEMTGAVVVLGSASPDVASYYKGLRKEYRLFLMPDRISAKSTSESPNGTSLADVELADMRQELREGHRDIFSRKLMSAMKDCLNSGDQMILFLNRRGTSAFMQCRNCGFGMRCRRCDVSVTYHRQQKRLICHYCGDKRPVPEKCPNCLAYRLSFYGIGTQMVVDEVADKFPEATILRWDRDAARSPKTYEELLKKFKGGEAQVLVGTQMIAKGLHFPNVTLVGVVSADIGLNIPDYRAGERSFQLLCQVAGRAGRGESPGRVIIQTFQPENYAVNAAAAQDYQAFYRKEMSFRRQQGNPPYSKLIRLLYTHKNQAQCEREALHLENLVRQQQQAWGLSDIDVLGPMPAYPSRLKGHYRWHLVLRGPEPRSLLDKVNVPNGWVIDVDPIALT